jgi:tRNA-specific 2-thiouridylase
MIQNMIENKKIRVVCAMSGGVDSAVAAALLKRSDFEVIGVFMKLWVDDWDSGARKSLALSGAEELGSSAEVCLPQNRCCTEESEQRARQTALQLGMPFYVLDVRNEFKKLVVDRFLQDTKKGLTPNPCVICNQEIKFGLLIEKALAMDAEYVATGHYTQIKKTNDGTYRLLKGTDTTKDQSYFLWRLGQKQLARIIFPVGCFEKKEVRRLAKKWKLPSALTPESQEVCFANGDIDKFLEKHCGTNPGDIVDISGKVIGRHNGLWFYTIGQRKGIRLSGGPFYVVKKNRAKNRLIVASALKVMGANWVGLEKLKWVSGAAPSLPLSVKTKTRYRAREIAASLRRKSARYELDFLKPQSALTPGQSAVFYRGREILGGGIIR